MKGADLRRLPVLLALLVACSCTPTGTEGGEPTPSGVKVLTLERAEGGRGMLLRLYGKGFSATKANNKVWFGPTEGYVYAVKLATPADKPDTLEVITPVNTTTGAVKVEVGGQQFLSAQPYTVVPYVGRLPVKVDAPVGLYWDWFTQSLLVCASGDRSVYSIEMNFFSKSRILDGSSAATPFGAPVSVVRDAEGDLIVAATNRLWKLTADNVFSKVAGPALGTDVGLEDGSGTAVRFQGTTGLGYTTYQRLFVSEDNNQAVREVFLNNDSVKTRWTGGRVFAMSEDAAGEPLFYTAMGTTATSGLYRLNADNTATLLVGGMDPSDLGDAIVPMAGGGYYVTGRWRLYKVTAAGVVSTLAGTGATGNWTPTDGPLLTANLPAIGGMAVSPDGLIYVADQHNGLIRVISL